jgi:hypothetical protein
MRIAYDKATTSAGPNLVRRKTSWLGCGQEKLKIAENVVIERRFNVFYGWRFVGDSGRGLSSPPLSFGAGLEKLDSLGDDFNSLAALTVGRFPLSGTDATQDGDLSAFIEELPDNLGLPPKGYNGKKIGTWLFFFSPPRSGHSQAEADNGSP